MRNISFFFKDLDLNTYFVNNTHILHTICILLYIMVVYKLYFNLIYTLYFNNIATSRRAWKQSLCYLIMYCILCSIYCILPAIWKYFTHYHDMLTLACHIISHDLTMFVTIISCLNDHWSTFVYREVLTCLVRWYYGQVDWIQYMY